MSGEVVHYDIRNSSGSIYMNTILNQSIAEEDAPYKGNSKKDMMI